MLNKLLRNSRNLLILGALLAAIAFALAFSVLSKAQSPASSAAAPPPTPTPIPAPALIAKSQVPAFTPINDLPTAMQYFRVVPVKGYVDPDYVKGPTGLAELLVQGPRHLAIRIPAGQPLLASELISNTVGSAVDYSALLNAGEVAETVAVQPVGAVNGNIQPSDHVDVLLSLKIDVTKDSALRHAFFNDNGTPLTSNTQTGTWVGSIWETQTTIQNVRVLNVSGGNYTLALSHQDALLLKWAKDAEGSTIELVVRAGDDSGKKPRLYHTTAILPDYLMKDRHMSNKFVLP